MDRGREALRREGRGPARARRSYGAKGRILEGLRLPRPRRAGSSSASTAPAPERRQDVPPVPLADGGGSRPRGAWTACASTPTGCPSCSRRPADDPVWIVEGEKDVDRPGPRPGRDLQPDGRGEVAGRVLGHLRGPDLLRDPRQRPPGRTHAAKVAGLAPRGRLVGQGRRPARPGVPRRPLRLARRRGDLEELGRLAYAAPEWSPTAEGRGPRPTPTSRGTRRSPTSGPSSRPSPGSGRSGSDAAALTLSPPSRGRARRGSASTSAAGSSAACLARRHADSDPGRGQDALGRGRQPVAGDVRHRRGVRHPRRARRPQRHGRRPVRRDEPPDRRGAGRPRGPDPPGPARLVIIDTITNTSDLKARTSPTPSASTSRSRRSPTAARSRSSASPT
jgi:hypothetical protein